MEAYLRQDIQPILDELPSESVDHEHDEEETFAHIFTQDMPNINLVFGDDIKQIQEDIQLVIKSNENDTEINVTTESQPSEGSPTCFSCAKKCKFKSGHDIKKGTHLVYGHYLPVTKGNEMLDKIIKKLSTKFGLEQPFFYDHHAIVTDVIETSDKTATIKVVEFQSLGSFTFKVLESKEPKTINIETDTNVFYKDYNELPYTDDEIVERARGKVGESAYNLIFNNCEHIAVWCVSGERESFQAADAVDGAGRKVLSWIGTVVGKIVNFFSTTDEIILGSNVAKYTAFAIPFFFLAGGFFLIELLFTVTRFIKLKHHLKKGMICLNCYNRRKNYLVTKIICSVIASLGLFFLPPMSGLTTTIASIAVGIAATFILPSLLSFIYRKIKTLLHPLYEIPKMIITKTNHINPGDIINIPDNHDVVVKSVTKVSRKNPSKFVNLQIVHFQCCGVLSTRTVEKELFTFELEKDLLEVFDFDVKDVYENGEVVEKALAKIGEKGFNTFWNRSSHMSKFCKVKYYCYNL